MEDNFTKNLNFMFMILFTTFLSFLDLLALCYVLYIIIIYDLRIAVLLSASKPTTMLRSNEPEVISAHTKKVSRFLGLEVSGWRPTVTAVKGER